MGLRLQTVGATADLGFCSAHDHCPHQLHRQLAVRVEDTAQHLRLDLQPFCCLLWCTQAETQQQIQAICLLPVRG